MSPMPVLDEGFEDETDDDEARADSGPAPSGRWPRPVSAVDATGDDPTETAVSSRAWPMIRSRLSSPSPQRDGAPMSATGSGMLRESRPTSLSGTARNSPSGQGQRSGLGLDSWIDSCTQRASASSSSPRPQPISQEMSGVVEDVVRSWSHSGERRRAAPAAPARSTAQTKPALSRIQVVQEFLSALSEDMPLDEILRRAIASSLDCAGPTVPLRQSSEILLRTLAQHVLNQASTQPQTASGLPRREPDLRLSNMSEQLLRACSEDASSEQSDSTARGEHRAAASPSLALAAQDFVSALSQEMPLDQVLIMLLSMSAAPSDSVGLATKQATEGFLRTLAEDVAHRESMQALFKDKPAGAQVSSTVKAAAGHAWRALLDGGRHSQAGLSEFASPIVKPLLREHSMDTEQFLKALAHDAPVDQRAFMRARSSDSLLVNVQPRTGPSLSRGPTSDDLLGPVIGAGLGLDKSASQLLQKAARKLSVVRGFLDEAHSDQICITGQQMSMDQTRGRKVGPADNAPQPGTQLPQAPPWRYSGDAVLDPPTMSGALEQQRGQDCAAQVRTALSTPMRNTAASLSDLPRQDAAALSGRSAFAADALSLLAGGPGRPAPSQGPASTWRLAAAAPAEVKLASKEGRTSGSLPLLRPASSEMGAAARRAPSASPPRPLGGIAASQSLPSLTMGKELALVLGLADGRRSGLMGVLGAGREGLGQPPSERRLVPSTVRRQGARASPGGGFCITGLPAPVASLP